MTSQLVLLREPATAVLTPKPPEHLNLRIWFVAMLGAVNAASDRPHRFVTYRQCLFEANESSPVAENGTPSCREQRNGVAVSPVAPFETSGHSSRKVGRTAGVFGLEAPESALGALGCWEGIWCAGRDRRGRNMCERSPPETMGITPRSFMGNSRAFRYRLFTDIDGLRLPHGGTHSRVRRR